MYDADNPFPRELYLRKLRSFHRLDLIKGLFGVRGCGKSTILRQFKQELIDEGIPESRICFIDFQNSPPEIHSGDQLVKEVILRLGTLKGSYVFLDGAYVLDDWIRCIRRLYAGGADIYITGPPTKAHSSNLAVCFSARCVGITVDPLSFSEYVQYRKCSEKSRNELFEDYMHHGGLPMVATMEDTSPECIPAILSKICDDVIQKDIIERDELSEFQLRAWIDGPFARSIENASTRLGWMTRLRNVWMHYTEETIEPCLGSMESAMLISRLERQDLKIIWRSKSTDVFYSIDSGICNTLASQVSNELHILMSVVCSELIRRYMDVFIFEHKGNTGFFVHSWNYKGYFVLCMGSKFLSGVDRVVHSLKSMDDNYPKTILTNMAFGSYDIDGILIEDLISWLLKADVSK